MITTSHRDDDGHLDTPITARRVAAGTIVRTSGLGPTIVTTPAWVIDVDCGTRAEQILISQRALQVLFDGLDLAGDEDEITLLDAAVRVPRI